VAFSAAADAARMMDESELGAWAWRHVDLEARVVRLDPHTTKNDEGRTFPFSEQTKADEAARTIPITSALRELLAEQRRQIGKLDTPYVFTFFATTPKGLVRKKRAGTQISYPGWNNAFRDARLAASVRSSIIPHDCRRTAIDRMERLGIARSTAMAMVGHKTESTYRRYAIVSGATLEDAGKRLDAGQ
jgi:integrase